MIPVIGFATAFALFVGLSANEPPRFVPLGPGKQGLALQFSDPTPAHDVALDARFVPVAEPTRARVLDNLKAFAGDWQARKPRISVTATDLGMGAADFALQLEGWLKRFDLNTADPELPELLGEVSRSPDVRGLTILCREQDRAIARDLALAIAPVVRGEVTIMFSPARSENQLDIFIEGAPRFAEAGIAYFPAVDVDA
jgi:hypothetical protein